MGGECRVDGLLVVGGRIVQVDVVDFGIVGGGYWVDDHGEGLAHLW